ncbi:MAG: HNH endonuclease [Salinivirgaceae bacterium]|jgi:5-methylcytosine-specific restriction protein A|nr:HNH endonuclease [Salinivirgaceae bacterium]
MKVLGNSYIAGYINDEKVNYEISFRKKHNSHLSNFKEYLPESGKLIKLKFKDLTVNVEMGVDKKCLSSPIDKKGFKNGKVVKLTQKSLIDNLSLTPGDKIHFQITQNGAVFNHIKTVPANEQINSNNRDKPKNSTINIKLLKPDWNLIINNPEITTDYDLSIFQALYSFENHQAYASQIGLLLGHSGKTPQSPINLEIGKYAKRIAQHFDIEFTKRENKKFKYWDLFFNGWDEGNFFMWQLKPEIIDALEHNKLTGIELISEEFSTEESEDLFEGAKKTITINAYERNPKARSLCLEHWGTKCAICGFDFEKAYGEFGKGFIHVHHLIPVAQIGKSYQIDPISDLRPVCPNCHAMIHLKNPPMTIDKMKELINASR